MRPPSQPHLGAGPGRARALPDQPVRHDVRGDHRLVADQDRPQGQHHRQFQSRIHDQPAGLRDPQRHPCGASRCRLRAAHPHQCGNGAVHAQVRPAAADADGDALVARRLSRLRRRGGRPRRAGAPCGQSRRQRGDGPAQPRAPGGRADHRAGLQQHLSAGAGLPDATAGDGLQCGDIDAAAGRHRALQCTAHGRAVARCQGPEASARVARVAGAQAHARPPRPLVQELMPQRS